MFGPTYSLSLESPEPIAGPSNICTSPVPEVYEDLESPENLDPVVFDPRPIEIPPQIRKKYVPPKQKKQKIKTTIELKRTLYLKRIKLADMEINFKKKMNALELKIKEKELDRLMN
jgi:hypothetical protein